MIDSLRTKIKKVEDRKSNFFEFYAKPHPIFYKKNVELALKVLYDSKRSAKSIHVKEYD